MCFQVPPKMFSSAANQAAVNSRLLVRRPKNGFQTCCGEHVEQTVDDVWQIVDAGDRELQTQAHSSQRDILEPAAEDND